MLQLVKCLLCTGVSIGDSPESIEADELSDEAGETACNFLTQLCECMQKLMTRGNSNADNCAIEKKIIQQISLSLQDEVTRRTIQILQNIPGLTVYPSTEMVDIGINSINNNMMHTEDSLQAQSTTSNDINSPMDTQEIRNSSPVLNLNAENSQSPSIQQVQH